jgi:hypothetical protein
MALQLVGHVPSCILDVLGVFFHPPGARLHSIRSKCIMVCFFVQLYLHFTERRQGASRYGLRCPSNWVVVEDSLFPVVGVNSGTVVLLTYPTRF